jgi:hypothetical protein
MKQRRIEWFMIWAMLAFSAVVVGLFYLVMLAVVFQQPIYRDHRPLFISGLALAGITLWFAGRWRASQHAAQAEPEPAGPGENQTAQPARALSILSLQYWGAMAGLCSLLLVISCTWGPAPKQAAALPPPPKRIQKAASAQPAPPPKSKPPQTAPALPPKLKVQALLLDRQAPSVIIDRKTYCVGDTVAGAEILTISRTALTVRYQGETSSYTMPQ